MCDDNRAHPALGRDPLDNAEKMLRVGEPGRSLVEDQELRVDRQRLGHLGKFAVPMTEGRERPIRVHIEPHLGQEHRSVAVEQPTPDDTGRLAKSVEQHVLGDRHVWNDHRFLRDESDARRERVVWPMEAALPPTDRETAVVGGKRAGEDPGQRRLTAAVLSRESNNFTVVDGQGDIPQRSNRSERLADCPRLQQWAVSNIHIRPPCATSPSWQRGWPPAWCGRPTASFTAAQPSTRYVLPSRSSSTTETSFLPRSAGLTHWSTLLASISLLSTQMSSGTVSPQIAAIAA